MDLVSPKEVLVRVYLSCADRIAQPIITASTMAKMITKRRIAGVLNKIFFEVIVFSLRV